MKSRVFVFECILNLSPCVCLLELLYANLLPHDDRWWRWKHVLVGNDSGHACRRSAILWRCSLVHWISSRLCSIRIHVITFVAICHGTCTIFVLSHWSTLIFAEIITARPITLLSIILITATTSTITAPIES